MIEENNIIVDGLSISYLDNGIEGNLCLCLHGNSGSKEVFTSFLKTNNKQRCVAIDLPGHGLSARMDYYAPSTFINFVKKFVFEYGQVPKKIIGHSFGGHIAIWLSDIFHNLEIDLISTPPFDSNSLHLNPYLPNEATRTFAMSNPSKEELEKQFPLISTDKNLFQVFSYGFQHSDRVFRETLFQNILSEGVINEVELIKNNSSPVILFLGENDQVVNHDYIQNLIDQNVLSNVVIIPKEAHLFDFSKLKKT